ncbi:bile acid-coenzyme A ligase [Bradyrhizobium sp. cir1]|uniref:AMP-binding protein n=1 Tax=Bradyrhizobium sp. cir1 TaxID=1445730 RepID=UPI00179EACBC|nr:AMP-binding protein [Bradyrhizobium sp. cir1]MBB4375149.1 bile acid-coenzyme A ligase [Bradyrhizobium sp. cir1]
MMKEDLIPLGEKLSRHAQTQPNAPAVSCGEVTLTYAQLDARVNRIARALEHLGVNIGDRVTIGLPNGVEFIQACWALWKLGATPQPVSFRLTNVELQAIVDLADPRLVIALPGMEASRRRVTVEDLLALCDDESPMAARVSPCAKAMTSGGSTGRPKLIVSNFPGVTSADGTERRLLPDDQWRIGAGETMVVPGPLYHGGPFTSSQEGLVKGAHVVLMPRFDAELVLAEIRRRRATWLYLVPTMMNRIWRLPKDVRAQYDISSLKTLWHLAAPCPPWLKEAFIRWLGPDVILECYGGSETQVWTKITGSEWLEHRGSVGRVLGGEIIAVGPDGNELPRGAVGEIYMRGPVGSPPRYTVVGAPPPASLPGGWETLGDIGYFDADGYLYLVDRRADMILVGGANVYPAEVEAAIDEHPLVLSSAVVGLPDEDMGSTVHAIVQARPGLTADTLLVHLEHRLVGYKRPRTFEFVDEPLRDDAGKVRRTRLRDERIARTKLAASQG